MPDSGRPGFQFQEQIDFFRQKTNLPTATWTDIQHEEHDRSFVVAGAARDDLLSDFRAAVDKAISKGTSLEEFRKDFDKIVATHGWTYNGGRNWRSRVIYEVNLRTSYAAGRWAQIQETKATRPYVRYRHNDSVIHPRPLHVSWDGLVLSVDSPWLKTHWPPNGWLCRCFIESLSKADLEKLGKTGPDTPPPSNDRDVLVGTRGGNPRVFRTPEGVDPGFGYTPGRSLSEGMIPSEGKTGTIRDSAPTATPATAPATQPSTPLPSSATPAAPTIPALAPEASAPSLPAPRAAPASRILPADLTEAEYVEAFLGEFGASGVDRKALFEDVTGEFLTISDELFRDARGSLKVGKRDRSTYLLLLADTIKRPDEVWVLLDELGVRRRYVAQWLLEGDVKPTLAVFEWSRSEWNGVTAFAPTDAAYLDRRARLGEMVYARSV